jgi:hypothetical protein
VNGSNHATLPAMCHEYDVNGVKKEGSKRLWGKAWYTLVPGRGPDEERVDAAVLVDARHRVEHPRILPTHARGMTT